MARFDPLNRLILAGKLGIEGNGDNIGDVWRIHQRLLKVLGRKNMNV